MADNITTISDAEFLDNFITSSEARSYAENANARKLHPKTRNELQELKTKILVAANLGETIIKIEGELRSQTIQILQEKGFIIELDEIPSLTGRTAVAATKIKFG